MTLLATAVANARATADRDVSIEVLKTVGKYHGGYTDFPAADGLQPDDGETDIAVDATVSILFDMDVDEADLSGIDIEATTPVTNVVATLVGRTITIAHDNFANSELHTVIIPAGAVVNEYGVGNRRITWSFTTVAAGP
jgi:hypothetical protein